MNKSSNNAGHTDLLPVVSCPKLISTRLLKYAGGLWLVNDANIT